jgi:putative Holliday junction resolvase
LSTSSATPIGRIAGIDFGTKRIGIAITDKDQLIASPYENYDIQNPEKDADRFRAFVKSEDVVLFVVGLPVHMSGNESQKSLEARQFGAWLEQETATPVVFFDERFTTRNAEELLQQAKLTKKKRQRRLDMLAAQLLLSAYLESSRSSAEPGSLDD